MLIEKMNYTLNHCICCRLFWKNYKNMKFNFSKINKDDGFLVQILYLLFYILERISVFYWVRVIGRKMSTVKSNEKPFVDTYIFPEIWVVLNLIFAIGIKRVIENLDTSSINNVAIRVMIYAVFIYSFLRVVEMFVYQINVLLFHRLNQYMWIEDSKKIRLYKKKLKKQADSYVLKSATRTIIMLILNMIEYVLQFSVMFTCLSVIFNNPAINVSLVDSFQLFMLSSGMEDFEGKLIFSLVYFEIVIGIFMNILCIGRFINEMPNVKKIDN